MGAGELGELSRAVQPCSAEGWFADVGEPKEFLCMHIQHKGSTIQLDQCAYLEKVIERCGLQNAKPTSTPLPTGYYALPNDEPADPELCS